MAEFSFTPDVEAPNTDDLEFSFTPDKGQETTDFNVKNYNGTFLIGEAGEDAKPYSKMDLFLKNLFTFDVKTGAEVEERQANNPRIQALEKVRADGFDDVKWGEVGKSLVRGSLELGKSATASPLKIYGDWSMDERDTSLMTPQELKDVKDNNFKAQAYIKTGEYIEKLWDMGLKAEWLKEDEETFRGSFVENPSMTRVLSLGASAIPSIGFFGGAAKITGSRKAASILLAGADNDDLYFEAREAGESQNKALGLYATGTAGTAILEKYGFDQIFNQRVTAPLSKRIMSATLSEGFTEGFQTAYQNAVKKYGYDDTQDLFEGVVESVIAGALSGGAISTADAGYIKLQNARGELKDKGATDEALDMMQEEFARELSYHRDTIEPMFQSKITESLNNLEKFVKDNEGTAEAQKALKTKAELETIYNNTYNELKNIMPEQEAKSNAALIRNSAFFFAEEFGISPEEFVKQRGVKVVKSDYNSFNDNNALEQAMYRSKLNTFSEFYDDVMLGENKKPRYFTEDINGIALDIPMNSVEHDVNKHNLTKEEWLGIIDAIRNNQIKETNLGDKSVMNGIPVKMVVDVNGVEYGVVFERMKNGRNLVQTAFLLQDKGWVKERTPRWSPFTHDLTVVSLGRSMSDIISNLDNNVNGLLQQQTPFQESLNIAQENAELDKVNPKYEGETININGVERTVYNSNGHRIAMSEPALRNFYNWFGDSKAVNEYGEPLDLFHGTGFEFDAFDGSKPIFLSDSKDVAQWFAIYGKGTVEGRNIKTVYAKISNPLVVDAKGALFGDIEFNGQRLSAEDISNYAKENGYDGVIINNVKEAGSAEILSNDYVVFNPNQIKSTSNRGTYSESDNIYYQSAFAGSRVDYDRPSLEAIGSGEGAQVHGWGLYYALSKDVAEEYRKTFSKQSGYKYNGKELNYLQFGKYNSASGKRRALQDIVVKSKGQESEEEFADIVEELKNKYKTIIEDAKKYDTDRWKREAKIAEENLKGIEQIDFSKLEKVNKGQVHEVDIPENPYLLDEQLPFSEQSDFVKQQLMIAWDNLVIDDDKIVSLTGSKTNPYKNVARHKTGREIYKDLENILGSNKAASELLEKYGIKGITYDGRQDGRCFVIFNPDDVKVIQKFYQDGANDPKGAYVNRIIHLFQNADASTLPHELAHFWKDTLKDAAKISKRVAKMLEDVEKWAEQEFNRKYSVQKRGTQYVVVNKQGLVVYGDRERVKFYSESDAKSYAQEEIFAQGFETYLKEGVAPNNSLKQAFRNFLSWLKHLLSQGKVLDIRLSPVIKEVYADILGGSDIDFFLNTDAETFIENRIKLAKATERGLDEQIAEAQRNGFVRSRVKKALKKAVQYWEDAVIPLSTRLKRINPKLRTKLRRYEFDVANNLNKYYQEAKPFLDIWNKFSLEDSIAFDIALKNDYVKKQIEIVEKYGAREEWEKVRKLLLDIFDNAVKAGLDINYRPDYFPRIVEDYEGFMNYMQGRPDWNVFESALKDADPDGKFSLEEQADFINKYYRGFVKADIMPSKFGNEKQRSIDHITNEMNQYYKPSIEALINYIEGMNARIEASKFLGKDAENIDASIGGFTDYLLSNKEIEYKDVDRVKRILKARFNQRGVHNEFIAGLRDLSYVYTMGGINSAITQIEDISVSLYKTGVKNTFKTAFKKKDIKRSDLGLEKIGQEFIDNPSKTAQAVNVTFKLSGLDKIDAWGKETLANSSIAQYKQMSDKELRKAIEPIMEQETNQTIKDIRNDVLSDRVLFLVYNGVSDFQPISLSELPAYYNTGGNLRIVYMLKSFMLKRIDIFRNECYDKIFGDTDKKTKIEGVQNLFRLAMLMVICGATKDWIINFLYNRIFDLSETVVNNILGLAGISKFHLYQARDRGIEDVIKDFLFPPILAPWNDLWNDISRLIRVKTDLWGFEVVKGIPWFGRFIYWHFGRGKEKMNKKKNKLK